MDPSTRAPTQRNTSCWSNAYARRVVARDWSDHVDISGSGDLFRRAVGSSSWRPAGRPRRERPARAGGAGGGGPGGGASGGEPRAGGGEGEPRPGRVREGGRGRA